MARFLPLADPLVGEEDERERIRLRFRHTSILQDGASVNCRERTWVTSSCLCKQRAGVVSVVFTKTTKNHVDDSLHAAHVGETSEC